MMIKIDSSHGTSLSIEHTPHLSKRYLVRMKADSGMIMAQATDALILNWFLLETDGCVSYRLNDETDGAVVKQFIEDTQK